MKQDKETVYSKVEINSRSNQEGSGLQALTEEYNENKRGRSTQKLNSQTGK